MLQFRHRLKWIETTDFLHPALDKCQSELLWKTNVMSMWLWSLFISV